MKEQKGAVSVASTKISCQTNLAGAEIQTCDFLNCNVLTQVSPYDQNNHLLSLNMFSPSQVAGSVD